MIRLADLVVSPVHHELAPDAWVETGPLTTFIRAVALAAARRRLGALVQGGAAMSADLGAFAPYGLDEAALPDWKDPDVESGAFEVLVLEEILVRCVRAWAGVVGPEAEPVEASAEMIRRFCRCHPQHAERIYRRVLADEALRSAAGNVSWPAGAGVGPAGQTIAQHADA
jgi:hypothetical protein